MVSIWAESRHGQLIIIMICPFNSACYTNIVFASANLLGHGITPINLLSLKVEQYMGCLPKEKVPLRGSDGDKLRIQQFTRQLPTYDNSLDACHKMTDLEKKRMTKLIERRKTKFFGTGEVDTMTADESKV